MFQTAYSAYNNLPQIEADKTKEPKAKQGLLSRSENAMTQPNKPKTEIDRVARYVANIRSRREAIKFNGE